LHPVDGRRHPRLVIPEATVRASPDFRRIDGRIA
jgi:hypothetical protein